ncbi:hypothetical protein FHL15_007017 [Xylaria flabelliformis]|uniref:Uncharacterized protein n=1 Tax=Xylaria flabelliformis TaxID=2512241 RepID=A0A553HW30_9PEZI|nr:hypothetical protein FHL15_007017 [Xylaria flabelliformis]
MPPTNMNTSSAQEITEIVSNVSRDETDSGVTAVPIGDKVDTNASLRTASCEDYKEPQTNENVVASDSLNMEAINNENETLDAVIRFAQRVQHPVMARKLLDEEKKRGTVAKRSVQATIHNAFTEQRIKDLEDQLRQIQIDLYKLPANFNAPIKEEAKHPIFHHALQRSTPDRFEMGKELSKIPFKDRPALEALVVEQLTDLETQSGTTGLSNTVPKSLRIRPRPLIAHLRQVTRTRISDNLLPPEEAELEQDSIVFLQPFKLFVTHEAAIRQSLRDLEEKDHYLSWQQGAPPQSNDNRIGYNDKDLLLDLQLLVKFMDEDMRQTFDLRQSIKEGIAIEIEYQDLWHLFAYGDAVVVQSDRSHAYRVLSFTGGRDILIDRLGPREATEPATVGFMIDCLSIKFDGLNYIPQLDTFSIRPFIGRQSIRSLSVYPLKFDKDSENLKRDMIEQGRRYLDVTIPSQSHRHLLGRTLDEPSHEIDAQVIIDMSMALNSVPEWRLKERNINKDQFTKADRRETFIPSNCLHNDKYDEGCCGGDIAFKDLDMDDQNVNQFFQNNQRMLNGRRAKELDDEDLMLLPCDIHGFLLRNRQWITLRVADLSEVRFENSFDELMLPEKHKSAIQALVNVHENAATKTEKGSSVSRNGIDLVKGKGAGLILLLHGEPAECVADHAKRPLFPITCGDIGETATEVEKNLHYNFRLAHKWGCVLLLDEADVFLAKRNKTDLRRNAVTSVFLRSLEYYAGILFLTTNRVGSIDPAFKSRIHISLFYPKFDLDATLKLYSTYIKRTRLEQERLQSTNFKIKEKEIMKFARRHFRQAEKEGLGTWNGRQIRNAFQAAIALVEYDSQQTKDGSPRPTLGEAQFNIVAESSREFDRYLVSTLGAADSDIARREEWRFDRFRNQGPKQPISSQSYDLRKPGFYGKKYDETEDDDDDDDDTSSDEDRDNDDGDGDESVTQRHSDKRTGVKGKNVDMSRDEAEQYQEYLEWKRARKSGKGHR